ncbi:MAG: hypothetical protein PHQ35_11090 [Phycisphaerae bacterium]|nr:hypothetical protein [Phycisphaerae bacterium]
MTEREAFEEFIKKFYQGIFKQELLKKTDVGIYYDDDVCDMDGAWQAALAWKDSQPIDPWTLFDGVKGHKYILDVYSNLRIVAITDITDDDGPLVVPLKNIDPSRDGETRTYNGKEFV